MKGHRDQWYGGRTYAQHGEDFIILNIFDAIGISRPSYLDCGAHHPFDLSNTALMYERGSRGINVDADPMLIQGFAVARPQDVNLAVAVGAKSGESVFYRARSSTGRSSVLLDVVEPHGVRAKLDVPMMSIGEIVDRHGTCPDFLSLDVEGLDQEVLAATDFDRYPFKVICAEAASWIKDSRRIMIATMEARGYTMAFRACSNLIFVRNDRWQQVRS